MYLYVQTPPVDSSNAIAHLIEHSIDNMGIYSIEKYFEKCDYNPETYFSYTKYDIGDQNYNNFITEIEKPLDKKIIRKEYKALREELREKSFVNKFRFVLMEKRWKKTTKNGLNIWDIISYHERYYNEQHYVLSDNDFNIIENWIKIEDNKHWEFLILNQFDKVIDWEKNFITILKYSHWKDQVLSDFIGILFDTRAEYNYRYIQWLYHYPYSCVIEWDGYIWIALPLISTYPEIDFINNAMKYYCTLIMEGKARENSIINLLYINQLPSKQDMISFIHGISIDTIMNIIRRNIFLK